MRAPRLSIVLATHNRAAVLAHTLDRLRALAPECGAHEIIVVDNASTENVGGVVAGRSNVEFVRLRHNAGSCAKAYGVQRARGALILFLDDDSYPRPGSVERMLRHFDADPRLGAAGFTVHLQDGSQECSALPHVFVGCGVGLRATALHAVGGLDASFFMQAEEYDLSFRLLRAGWKVEVCGDLAVDHLKTPHARRAERTTYYDVANNLRVIGRYLPASYVRIYRADWLDRYARLATAQGHTRALRRGRRAGWWRGLLERPLYRRWRLTAAELEQVFAWEYVAARMGALRAVGVRRVVLADYGKNVYAFHRGARAAGIAVAALADDGHARGGVVPPYRGVPVVTVAEARALRADAWVVSNTSYVHAARRVAELERSRVPVPVYNWFPAPAALSRQVSVSVPDAEPVGAIYSLSD
jgi:GT2 family glycosyltransferase